MILSADSKRSQAIEAGERVTDPEQKQSQLAACREYRATKQRKQRTYIKKCIDDIKFAFRTNRTDIWRTICRMCGTCAVNEPCDDDFFDHFKCLNSPDEKDYFVDNRQRNHKW